MISESDSHGESDCRVWGLLGNLIFRLFKSIFVSNFLGPLGGGRITPLEAHGDIVNPLTHLSWRFICQAGYRSQRSASWLATPEFNFPSRKMEILLSQGPEMRFPLFRPNKEIGFIYYSISSRILPICTFEIYWCLLRNSGGKKSSL